MYIFGLSLLFWSFYLPHFLLFCMLSRGVCMFAGLMEESSFAYLWWFGFL
jgi:hypothetical protein